MASYWSGGLLDRRRQVKMRLATLKAESSVLTSRKIMSGAVRQDKKIYEGTNWLNEELKGRVDKEGNIYRGAIG